MISHHLADNSLRNNRFDRAINEFSAAMEIDPENMFVIAFLMTRRSRAYEQIKNLPKALNDIEKTMDIYNQQKYIADDAKWSALEARARLRLNTNHYRGYIADLRAMWNMRPNDTSVQQRWAECYNAYKRSRKNKKYIELLGIDDNDVVKDVEKKYKQLLKQCHPDTERNAQEKAAKIRQTQELNQAFDYFKAVRPPFNVADVVTTIVID